MANIAVAHIVITGKADGKTMSLELRPRIGLVQLIQVPGECRCNSIAILVFSKSNAIHDNQDNWTLAGNLSHLLQCFNHWYVLLISNQVLLPRDFW